MTFENFHAKWNTICFKILRVSLKIREHLHFIFLQKVVIVLLQHFSNGFVCLTNLKETKNVRQVLHSIYTSLFDVCSCPSGKSSNVQLKLQILELSRLYFNTFSYIEYQGKFIYTMRELFLRNFENHKASTMFENCFSLVIDLSKSCGFSAYFR